MYTLLTKEIEIEGRKEMVYGIACGNVRVDDVSPDKAAVGKLIDHCNELELDEAHVQDVALDFVTQNALIS